MYSLGCLAYKGLDLQKLFISGSMTGIMLNRNHDRKLNFLSNIDTSVHYQSSLPFVVFLSGLLLLVTFS